MISNDIVKVQYYRTITATSPKMSQNFQNAPVKFSGNLSPFMKHIIIKYDTASHINWETLNHTNTLT